MQYISTHLQPKTILKIQIGPAQISRGYPYVRGGRQATDQIADVCHNSKFSPLTTLFIEPEK
jgi:hypothetical protein